MLFTWDTSNLCIVFRQWHITSNLSLVVSLAAVVALCAGYEALREGIRRYEAALAKRVDTVPRKCCLSFSCFLLVQSTPLLLCTRHNLLLPPEILYLGAETHSLREASQPGMKCPAPRRRHRARLRRQILRIPPSLRCAQARTGPRSRGGPTSSNRCCTASRTSTPS